MPNEQYTESMTLQSMKCNIGENSFGFVFPQGDVADVGKAERLLKKAGGKPKTCALDDFSLDGNVSGRHQKYRIVEWNLG